MRKLRQRVKSYFKSSGATRRRGAALRRHLIDKDALYPLTAPTDVKLYIKERGLKRATRTDFLHNGSFQDAVGPVLLLAQVFCLMPVRGIRAKSARGLSFSWKSCRTWYCLLYIVATTIDSGFAVGAVLKGALDVRNMEPVVFHFSILLASVLFLRLATKWPRLMARWERVERQLPPHRTWRDREQLARRIKIVTFVLISLSLMEHLLSTISAIHFANYCPSRKDPIESYFMGVSSQIFHFLDFSIWLGWLGKTENVLLTFGWTYMDVFVMIVGIGLSSLLERVERSMKAVQEKQMPECFWARTRVQYRLICELIEEVDEAVSSITMISFANNLYFVCIQCLKTLNTMPSVAHGIYFYLSLLFLLSRTMAVSLFLAEVNDRSRKPLELLKFVPKDGYNEEVQRFAHEMATELVAMTGMKFFNITRKLVLTIAGTIVTYELVLVQFHEDEKLWHCGTD